MTKTLAHARLATIDRSADELLIGGVSVSRVIEMAGRTPCYVYESAAIDARVQAVRRTLPATIKLHYAIKANPMPSLLGHMCRQVDGFDVASQGEMRQALNAGMSADAISFAGPGKSEEEIRAAIAAGVCLIIESETEIARVARQALLLGMSPSAALRVNP